MTDITSKTDSMSTADGIAPAYRRRRHVPGIIATLAMGSWFIVAAMPVAVLIAALT